MSAVSAIDIAEALAAVRGVAPQHPTPQQRAVIEAPLAPALVVAGAGSGKTETMANRVLWLLANGLVEPAQVLGLTFTRKAAGELGLRIRERIAELDAAGLLPPRDVFDAPVVATYNSFANTLYRESAILLGREGDAPVLGEAAAWQLARGVVIRSRDARLPDLGKNLDALTRAVLAVARGVAEHAGDLDEVRALSARLGALGDLPTNDPVDRFERLPAVELAAQLGALEVLADLAADYDAEKVRRGVVEYADQVALALRIAQKQPALGADLRDRYRVVLLDEYQDTSVVQTQLLAELFREAPVMAVGDPNQSIYGWRGASAANLDQFAEQFIGTAFGAEARFALSTSWRNGTGILAAANHLVAPFAGRGVTVERLEPSPVASDREVEAVFPETVAEEAAAVADWLAARVDPTTSAAMLLRARATQPYFLAALRDRGIPFHVLGIGGLLAEPEIADLVCVLSAIDDPAAGIQLLRVLAGSRFRVGVADLHALNRLAAWLRSRDHTQRKHDDEVRELLNTAVAPGEGGSIVDALDFLATAPVGHVALENFTAVGLQRLRDAGALLTRLRARVRLDLPDLVALVIQELRLDIEVAANEYRVLGSANLDAFADAVAGYLAIAEIATLSGFLGWLREAELREDLSPRPEPPEPGTVQVLTVHGAKGLEWDVVAVPRMVTDEFPAKPREGFQGWLGFGQYPWPLRGDAAELPHFAWEGATTRKELLDEQKQFSASVRQRALDEERRLAYVAVTRARHHLLLSGSFWATQAKPREPSVFLRDLADAGLIPALPDASGHAENPLGDDLERIVWPLDPLGSRRSAVEWAAEQVRTADPALTGPWTRDLELLLAEREARLAPTPVAIPTRVPASRFHDYVTEPERVAGELRRPMPERPFSATRLGTLFHAWVEQRFGFGTGAEEIDALVDEQDAGTDISGSELAALQARFEASEWAQRRPLEVEREIHLPFDGRVVICKIDAVYSEPDGRVRIIDWKTGRAPKEPEDLERKQLQLALYRLAYSRWAGIPEDRIDAAFYFVADDRVLEPDRIDSEEQLLARWRAAVG
ncbi:ATP-dependent helicase [Pseudolysinimonas yzui]|uniref:DNA 3'-5' helicase n=1 Tax=Pseudolysinimonas yzui TaxID=2708254 RepID=A0A8J3GMN0_9MICO|nr:ATP-dependent DNA helicase [Pseudolysinimonas yzui]GHF04907.1 ATP-dependent DNA helicase [Pseudolysinimonas yzui]